MKKLENKKKKILILSFIISILLIGVICIAIIFINNKPKPKEELKVELKDNLSFEINSEVNLLSLVSENNKVEIISKDENIDTSSLGEKEVIIKYKYDDKEKEYKFNINIIDTTKPILEYQKELSTNVETKIDLLKDVKVSDNSKEEIKATIEGEYDFNKVGTYSLKYVAVDSSNNKVEEEFTLKVNEKPKAPTNNNSSKPQTNNNTSNNTATSGSNSSNDECDKRFEEYNRLYFGKVFTSIPNNNPELSWNSARFYWTEEVDTDGKTYYQLHNERISGHNIGKSASSSIMQIVGNGSDMKYTKDNPIILYQWVGALYCE